MSKILALWSQMPCISLSIQALESQMHSGDPVAPFPCCPSLCSWFFASSHQFLIISVIP